MNFEDVTQDIILNLIAEALGIIATVFIIDRIIMNREERRWRPSRQAVYARLLIIIDELLDEININLGGSLYKDNEQIYEMGSAVIHPHIKIEKPDEMSLTSALEQALEIELLPLQSSQLRQTMERLRHDAAALSKEPELSQPPSEVSESERLPQETPMLSKWVKLAAFSHAKEEIGKLLEASAFLLEPTPTQLLLELNRSLITLLEYYIEQVARIIGDDNMTSFFFASLLKEVIEDATALGLWLEGQVTKRYRVGDLT